MCCTSAVEGKPFNETFPLEGGKIANPGMSYNSKGLYSHHISERQRISSHNLSTELLLCT